MASGSSLLLGNVLGAALPASTYPQFDTRNNHPVLDFDAGADEAVYFEGILPRNYGGGGLTLYIHYAMTSATSGNVVLGGAFERIGDEQQDIDSDSFASEKTVTDAVPGTSGNVAIASIAFTNGAEIDSIAVGEAFRLRIRRVGANGSDTATGDLELLGWELKET